MQRHMLVRRLVLNSHVYAFRSNVNHVATTTAEAKQTSTDCSQIDANDEMFREDKHIIRMFKKHISYFDKTWEVLLLQKLQENIWSCKGGWQWVVADKHPAS